MLRHFLTDEGFQSGIIRYLRRFRYSNARNEDLWDSLIKVGHFFIHCLFLSYIYNSASQQKLMLFSRSVQTCSEEEFTAGEHCYSSTQATKNAVKCHIINKILGFCYLTFTALHKTEQTPRKTSFKMFSCTLKVILNSLNNSLFNSLHCSIVLLGSTQT